MSRGSGAGNFWRRTSVNPQRKMAQVVRHGHHAMGKVSIWAQWLMITAGVLLSSVFSLILACLIGWLLFGRLWPYPEVPSGSPYAAR